MLMINQLMKEAHEIAKEHGFWDEDKEKKNIGEAIALMHSELSEGFEAYRNKGFNVWIDKKPDKQEGLPIELADCIIRIADFCQAFNIPLEHHIRMKMNYNKSRPYKHGKRC